MTPRKKLRALGGVRLEDDFLDRTFDLAEHRGWLFVQFTKARMPDGSWRTPFKGRKGFPDALFARDGVFLAVEFKSDTGTLSPEQKEWAEHIPGALHRVWRPKDWPEVARTLMAPRRRPTA